MPAHGKVLEHPPPSCTASTRGNYSGTDLKWRCYPVVGCVYEPLLHLRAAQRDKPSVTSPALDLLSPETCRSCGMGSAVSGFNSVGLFPCGLQTLRAEFCFAKLSLLVPSCDFQICEAAPAEFPPRCSGRKSFFLCHILANESNQFRLCF